MADNVDGVPEVVKANANAIDRFLGLDHPCAHWRLSFLLASVLVLILGFIGLIVGAVRKGDKAHYAMARFMRDGALPGLAIGILLSLASIVFLGNAASNKTLIVQSLALATFFLVMFGIYSAAEGHLYFKPDNH